MKEEILFVGTADAEHTEMYLKAIWHLRERGERCRRFVHNIQILKDFVFM